MERAKTPPPIAAAHSHLPPVLNSVTLAVMTHLLPPDHSHLLAATDSTHYHSTANPERPECTRTAHCPPPSSRTSSSPVELPAPPGRIPKCHNSPSNEIAGPSADTAPHPDSTRNAVPATQTNRLS